MPGMRINIEVRGLANLLRQMNRFSARFAASGVGGRAELHRRYGIQALNWIDDNFRQAGALTGSKWAKLRPNTIAGRRKGSSNPLQDSGLLRASFTSRATAAGARVGTPVSFAPYHEEGTDPYVIVPKRARALAFPVDRGFGGPKRKVRASFSSTVTRTTYRRGQLLGFAARVNHPGLPARPMLPRRQYPTMMARLVRATINYAKEGGLAK